MRTAGFMLVLVALACVSDLQAAELTEWQVAKREAQAKIDGYRQARSTGQPVTQRSSDRRP